MQKGEIGGCFELAHVRRRLYFCRETMCSGGDEIHDCLKDLERAFAGCRKPRTAFGLIGPFPLDGPGAIRNWEHLDRTQFERLEFFGPSLGEDLTYLSSHALRYFMPAVLALFLRNPEKAGPCPYLSGFHDVLQRLRRMGDIRKGENHWQIALTKKQIRAVTDWCDLMRAGISPFLDQWWDVSSKELLVFEEIKEHLPHAEQCVDYDIDCQEKMSDRPDRRTGWRQLKSKKDRPER